MGVERKQGGNLHPWLNIGERSIANKYPEGKLKSTSKGELKDLKSFRRKRVSATKAIRLEHFATANLSAKNSPSSRGAFEIASNLCCLTSFTVLVQSCL